MNKPLKPSQTAVPSPTNPGPTPPDELYYGVHKGEWEAVVEEAPQTTELYGRRGGGMWEIIADVAGLTVTEIVPAIANVGMTGSLTARLFGTGFTATTEVLWDGVVYPSNFVSANELTLDVAPSLAVAPTVAVVTVQDTAGPGTGAAGFHFVDGGGQYHFVVGLTHDDVTGDVNLTPAGDGPPTLGGVYVIDRERNNTEGLELGIDGRLRVPLATDSLAGSIVEPPPDDKGYVRRRDTAGVSAWVPPADPLDTNYGIGLSFDETTRDVNLQPAGDGPPTLGGVYVIDRERNVSEGLELGIDGRLRAPLATPRLAGTIVEPEDDGKGYVRTTLNGVSMWVPPATAAETHYAIGLSHDDVTGDVNLQPAGDSPATLGGVYVIDRERNNTEGLELGIDGRLRVPLATDSLAGSIVEPPPDDKGYVRRRDTAGVSAWVPPADTVYHFVTGLSFDETTRDVNLQAAGPTPELLGGVYVTPRDGLTQALELNYEDPATGELRAGPATDLLLGALVEPPQDGIAYSRFYDATASRWAWVPALTAGLTITGLIPDKLLVPSTTPITVHAYGSAFTPTCVLMFDGVANTTTTFVSDTELTCTVDPTPELTSRTVIVTVEDPAVPEIGAGAEAFEFFLVATDSLSIEFILPNMAPIGSPALVVEVHGAMFGSTTEVLLDGTPVNPPAALISPTEMTFSIDPTVELAVRIATVTVRDSSTSTLGLGEAPFYFTDAVEKYHFVTGLTHDETTGDVNLQPAGDALDRLGGVWVPRRDHQQGLELDTVNMTGELKVPLATPFLAGAMIEPPQDDKGYVRRTDINTGIGAWVPPAEGGGYNFVLGLTHDDTTDDVNLTPAGNTAEFLGGVHVPLRDAGQGLELNTTTGQLTAPLARDTHAGVITEPPPSGNTGFLRFNDGARSYWAPAGGGNQPQRPAGDTVGERGVVYIPPDHGLRGETDGRLTLLPATGMVIGGMKEALVDGKQYARMNAGWVEVTGGAIDYGIGLTLDDTTTPNPTVNLNVANANGGEIGGVKLAGRGPTQGLEYDIASGTVWAPLATEMLAGSIVDAPKDGKPYARTHDDMNGARWTETSNGAVIIADDPPAVPPTPGALWFDSNAGTLAIWYQDADSSQWVQVNGSQASGDYLPLTGGTMVGPIVLPSADPTLPEHATHKKYVDVAIANQALYQSTWLVATNVPDLTVAVANPLHGYSWTAVTANPAVPEVAPAGLPGIGGTSIASGDTIKYNATLLLYEHIKTASSAGGIGDAPSDTTTYGRVDATWVNVLPLTGGTVTGPVHVQSSAANGKMTLAPGDATNNGRIDWHNPDGTRKAYIGYAGSTTLQINLDGATRLDVKGGSQFLDAVSNYGYFFGDTWHGTYFNGSNTLIFTEYHDRFEWRRQTSGTVPGGDVRMSLYGGNLSVAGNAVITGNLNVNIGLGIAQASTFTGTATFTARSVHNGGVKVPESTNIEFADGSHTINGGPNAGGLIHRTTGNHWFFVDGTHVFEIDDSGGSWPTVMRGADQLARDLNVAKSERGSVSILNTMIAMAAKIKELEAKIAACCDGK